MSEPRWLFSETGPALGVKLRVLIDAAVNDHEQPRDHSLYSNEALADAIGMSPSSLSKAKSGRLAPGRHEYLYASALRLLASYFGLDQERTLGAEAWKWFTPMYSTGEFEAALMRVGYCSFALRRIRPRSPVDEQLAWLAEQCGLTRLGINVLNAADLPGPDLGQQRGAGVVDQVTEFERDTWTPLSPGGEFVVRVDAGPGSHCAIFQLCEQIHPPHFSLQCLTPSYRQVTTRLAADGVVPAGHDAQGRRGFALGDETGRFDVLVFVTPSRPLALPFTVPPESRYHTIEPMRELAALRATLQNTPGLRVLHAPVRVASRA